MQVNELRFGNPNRSHLVYLKTENYLDSLLPELSSYPPPANDSEQANQEIHQIIEYTTLLEKDEQLRRRYELYDSNFENYIIERLVNAGANKDEVEKVVREKKQKPKKVKVNKAISTPAYNPIKIKLPQFSKINLKKFNFWSKNQKIDSFKIPKAYRL